MRWTTSALGLCLLQGPCATELLSCAAGLGSASSAVSGAPSKQMQAEQLTIPQLRDTLGPDLSGRSAQQQLNVAGQSSSSPASWHQGRPEWLHHPPPASSMHTPAQKHSQSQAQLPLISMSLQIPRVRQPAALSTWALHASATLHSVHHSLLSGMLQGIHQRLWWRRQSLRVVFAVSACFCACIETRKMGHLHCGQDQHCKGQLLSWWQQPWVLQGLSSCEREVSIKL